MKRHHVTETSLFVSKRISKTSWTAGMDKKEKLSKIWAIADKPLIDMAKKTQRMPSTVNEKDSSDDTSDPESDSNNDFIALPAEFRPNLKQCPQKQTKNGNSTLNRTLKKQSIESTSPVPEQTTYNSPAERSLLSVGNHALSPQSNKQNSFSNDSPVPETEPKSKIHYEIVKGNNFQEKVKSKSNSETTKPTAKNSLSQQKRNFVKDDALFLQQRALSLKEQKNKKVIKYEHVQELQTIQPSFDNLSFKDTDLTLNKGLKYETKLSRNTHTNPKNSTRGENWITKQNTKTKSGSTYEQFSVSSERTTIKWDSSLNLNQDNKIEWTVIHEKDSLTVKRNSTSPQTKNQPVSEECHTNRATIKNSHRRNFNNSVLENADNIQHIKSKTNRQHSVVHKEYSNSPNNKLKSNLNPKINNLNYIIRNTDSTSDSDTEEYYTGRKNKKVARKHNVENMTPQSLPCETSVLLPNKSSADIRKTRPLLTKSKGQNNFSLLHQTEDYLKLLSDYNFQNLAFKESDLARIGSNISNNNSSEKPIGNKEQIGFSKLQQAESDYSLPACSVFTRRENLDSKLSEGIENRKETILRYGKEMSDLIIGSYDALNLFISFYREWAIARKDLIRYFEELSQQLKESSKRFSKFTDILQITSSGAEVATIIPNPVVSMAAKIVSSISALLKTFISNKADKSNIDDADETATAVLKDNRTSYDLYMYGLQCSQQFEETTKLIEDFHSNKDVQGFFDNENPGITTFIRGFLEFKPNHRIFYKKLHKCFQELLQTNNTEFSKIFCEPFTLYSESAVDVIGHLRWRFRHEDFDGSSVRHELEEIHRLIQNANSINVSDLQKRIQNCKAILTDELGYIDNIMKDIPMFDSSLDNKTVGKYSL